jgi:hypothetical protein
MRMANWHPLAWISHMADVQLLGVDPGWHHLSSVFFPFDQRGIAVPGLDVADGVVPAVALRDRRGGLGDSSAADGVGRVDRGAQGRAVRDVLLRRDRVLRVLRAEAVLAWYGATLLAFALGLLAKPMLVTFPCVLLLIDYWPLKRPVRWGLVVEKVPFA